MEHHRSNPSVLAMATLSVLATLTAACATDSDGGRDAEPAGPNCGGGKCDEADAMADAAATRAALEGKGDPIATVLREQLDDDGLLDLDYLGLLREVGAHQGCGDEGIDSYIISDELVVQGEGAFPRVVNTVCSTDRTKADLAFFALSFPNATGDDISTEDIEMFAWDDATRSYAFYKTTPSGDGRLRLEVEPPECAECHLQPDHVDGTFMRMTPIMNELTAPWEHWFAEPISVNHVVPSDIEVAPNFAALAGPTAPFRKSAGRLEQTIRSSFTQRIASSRLRDRRAKPADVEGAMALLRPLFCDEQLSYVTEDGASGLIAAGTVIDDGWHSVFFQTQGTGWPYEWWNDRQLRFAANRDDRLHMVPVRGASVVAYEKQLMAVRGLSAIDVARVRALDWQVPVMSEFRCELFHNALARVRASLPATIVIDDATRTSSIMAPLLREILTVHDGDFGLALAEPMSLWLDEDTSFVVVGRAEGDALERLVEIMSDGELGEASCTEQGSGVCAMTLEQMGDALEARFKAAEAAGRSPLREVRLARGCKAKQQFRNAPFIDGLSCVDVATDEPPPPEPEDDDADDGADSMGSTGSGSSGGAEGSSGDEATGSGGSTGATVW